ncbi:MAG: hypothetical protein AAGD96_32510 [Chloroflexota bacterium]
MLDFLKPTFFKINVALLLLTVVGYLVWPLIMSIAGVETVPFGFPLATRSMSFSPEALENLGDFESVNFVAVAVDVVFWYLVSSTLALRFDQNQAETDI